jgi:hypothetical protein
VPFSSPRGIGKLTDCQFSEGTLKNRAFRKAKMTGGNVREEILAVFGCDLQEAVTNKPEMFS